jgi:hypothetical protein
MYLIDLVFPPLVTLVLAFLAAAILRQGWRPNPHLLHPSDWLLSVHSVMALVLVCYVLSPLLAMDLPIRYLASLLTLPYYAVWKVITTTGSNPTAWVRTPREPMTSDAVGCFPSSG